MPVAFETSLTIVIGVDELPSHNMADAITYTSVIVL